MIKSPSGIVWRGLLTRPFFRQEEPCPVREFGNFAKTQGIWFAPVVNSLILLVKDISIFAAKKFQTLHWVCISHKSCTLTQGKFAVGQENRGFESAIEIYLIILSSLPGKNVPPCIKRVIQTYIKKLYMSLKFAFNLNN